MGPQLLWYLFKSVCVVNPTTAQPILSSAHAAFCQAARQVHTESVFTYRLPVTACTAAALTLEHVHADKSQEYA